MSKQETPAKSTDLREYIAIFRNRKWTIILSAIAVITLALAFSLTRTPMYDSAAKVLVEPVDNGSQITTLVQQPVDLVTQEEVASSYGVAEMVKEDLETDLSADDLRDGLSVSAVTESQVLQFVYTSDEPEFAQAAANSFAENYLEYRNEQGLEDLEEDEAIVSERVESTSQQLNEIEAQLDEAEKAQDEGLISLLSSQRNSLLARLGVLQERLEDLRTASSNNRGGGQLIEPGELPSSPSSPNHIINGILGLFVGLALGIALAFLRERLDDRFRGREDLEQVLSVPVLATIPRFVGSSGGGESGLVTKIAPAAIASESYRSLRTNLQFITSQRGIKSVVITSSSAGEGKSVTTANLGFVLAQAGRRTILVSTDLRRPTLASYYGIRDESGGALSTWLASDEQDISPLIQDAGISNLRLIPSGPIPPNPAELLSSLRFRQLLRTLEGLADVVILDSPPVLAVADAAVLATQAGGVMLIVDAGSTHRSASIQARNDLSKVGGQLIGTVINSYDPSDSPYYYQSYTGHADGEATTNGSGKRRRPKEDRKPRGRRRSRKADTTV